MYTKVSSNKQKPYSTKEFLKLTGLKRSQCFDIIKYLKMDVSKYYWGKQVCFCFDDNDVDVIKKFIREHDDIKLFLQKQTCLEKYGVDWFFKDSASRKKKQEKFFLQKEMIKN